MRYLIFGGTGSLGKKLIRRFIQFNDVFVFSRDEAKHFTIKNEYSDHDRSSSLHFIVGDIRDNRRVLEAIRIADPDVIIIAAALKQVDTCELSPGESVLTNIVGTQNVIDAVSSFTKKQIKLLFVSTDKAVSPVNCYGMCKAISERIISSSKIPNITFLCTRYGNVLESRGSIIPLFKYQSENAKHLTVTDPNMTRFVMTLDESVDLIEKTLLLGKNGETWIPQLPAMRIGDLAEIFAEQSRKPIKIIGLRPGEKTHEDLINLSESTRTLLMIDPQSGKKHYVVGSAAYTTNKGQEFSYSSNDDVMTKNELRKHLQNLNIISASLASFEGPSIEEIMTKRK